MKCRWKSPLPNKSQIASMLLPGDRCALHRSDVVVAIRWLVLLAQFQRFEHNGTQKPSHKHKHIRKLIVMLVILYSNICPVTKTVRKFGGKGGVAREVAETGARIRRSKLVTSVRSNIIRRRLVNRNRDAVRRAKLMRRYFHLIVF